MFNSDFVDSVYILAGEADWRILMTDMLGRAKTTQRGIDTPINEILGEVARYNPKHISVVG